MSGRGTRMAVFAALTLVVAMVVGAALWSPADERQTPRAAPAAGASAARGPGGARPVTERNGMRPVVSTPDGTVRGRSVAVPGSRRRVETFKGIPFAAPPVGSLRWRAPRPASAWKGTLDAAKEGPWCPQDGKGREDCLYLNVFRPTGTTSADRLPVMTFAFGGANVGGGAGRIDARRLAQRTGAVVVAPNYRLGALGFLAVDGSEGAGASGNYGVTDLRAALRWVQRSISSFGGDPRNVTLGGQSSGATNTCRLLVDPGARGLFSAAALASDDCLHDVDTPARAPARARALGAELGCDPTVLMRCLRSRSAEQITRAGGQWNPVAETSAADLMAQGRWNRVPVLLGSTSQEARHWGQTFGGYSAVDYTRWVRRTVGPRYADEVLRRYPATRYPGRHGVAYTMSDVITDSGMRGVGGYTHLELARALARQTPTFYYEFTDRTAPGRKGPKGYDLGASHGADMQFLFPSDAQWRAFSPRQRTLSNRMIGYYGAFLRHHRPDAAGQARWPALTAADQRMMKLAADGPEVMAVEDFRAEHHLNLWASIPVIMGRG